MITLLGCTPPLPGILMTSRGVSKEGYTLDILPGDLKRVLLGTMSKCNSIPLILRPKFTSPVSMLCSVSPLM